MPQMKLEYSAGVPKQPEIAVDGMPGTPQAPTETPSAEGALLGFKAGQSLQRGATAWSIPVTDAHGQLAVPWTSHSTPTVETTRNRVQEINRPARDFSGGGAAATEPGWPGVLARVGACSRR